jgi:hypothetical protein
MLRIALKVALVLVIIYAVPLVVYGLISVVANLKLPGDASPALFLASVFVSKLGTALAFVAGRRDPAPGAPLRQTVRHAHCGGSCAASRTSTTMRSWTTRWRTLGTCQWSNWYRRVRRVAPRGHGERASGAPLGYQGVPRQR